MKPFLASFHYFVYSLISLSIPYISLSARCNPVDKKALIEIKKGLGNPNELISWDPRTDCFDVWDQATLTCDDDTNRVTSLTLFKVDGTSYLSPAVGDLSYLRRLDVQKVHNLSAPIPSTIAKISNLTVLRISQTNVSGPVPEFLGKLKNLTYINLSDNNLEGTIPPSLSDLSNLLYLRLDRNKLIGPIPESFGNFAPKLEFLFHSQNKLSGSVPRSFAGWAFVTLDLSGNKLEGDISFLFGKDSNTFQLYLSRNKFEFDFSKIKFGEKLVSLVLNHNKIYGSFPAGFEKRPCKI